MNSSTSCSAHLRCGWSVLGPLLVVLLLPLLLPLLLSASARLWCLFFSPNSFSSPPLCRCAGESAASGGVGGAWGAVGAVLLE